MTWMSFFSTTNRSYIRTEFLKVTYYISLPATDYATKRHFDMKIRFNAPRRHNKDHNEEVSEILNITTAWDKNLGILDFQVTLYKNLSWKFEINRILRITKINTKADNYIPYFILITF